MLNNIVKLYGEIISDFEFSHSCKEETFLTFVLNVSDISGKQNSLNILINKNLLDACYISKGSYIYIEGEFHSYNNMTKNHNHLLLFCFAKKILLSDSKIKNYIFLNGYICKELKIRNIKSNSICDFIIAVNRKYKKSDYIPCVIFNSELEKVNNKKIGDLISIEGKIQSRKYIKKINDLTYENRIAYEVIVEKILQ